MPKFIKVTELIPSDEKDDQYDAAIPTWLNSDQILRVYSTRYDVVDYGTSQCSLITFVTEQASLSVLEAPEEIISLIEAPSSLTA
ncbi:hypothetical protein [Rhizobium ruizarguesonis]|uniref:hypothetical protein n=1 Tax=Rhizobium ruizarguesonis TaxID=2081791 RepID=UPI0013BD30D1|nr:hypothetical protein [Rhizobium ruizarguesonis]NEH64598.1 hypothetical protein [Rhizobium ruizarguesonis]NEH78090.1 hypothetical protein [Rhizobium ruizarguesonis]NEI78521.1 hypothetical protein [Rhizobium ruizarguesonis]